MPARQGVKVSAAFGLAAALLITVLDGCATMRESAPRSSGRSLVLSKCGACHIVPEPQSLLPGPASQLLHGHAERIRLSGEEMQRLLEYLSSAGKQTAQ